MALIEICGVSFRYNSHPVLAGLAFTVPAGSFLGIIGPNGSGKTTLAKSMGRLLRPTRGVVTLDGTDLAALPPVDLARRLGMVLQENDANLDFTVAEMVMLGRLPHVVRFRPETARDRLAVAAALTHTGLTDLAGRPVRLLSGGEKQRAFIARALAQEPEVLVLDEPTSHLDIASQVEIMDLLARLNREQGLTVVVVIHDLNLASLYCRRLLLLEGGRIRALGTADEVITPEHLTAVYGRPVLVRSHPATGRPQVFLLPAEPPPA